MKISVLIPAYNCAATIGKTLDSVLAQSVSPFEIVVLNDGSTDDTEKALEPYKPGVIVHSRSNRGVAETRNELAFRARGDLLAYLDSDDLWHPKYLEIQSKLFVSNPEAAAFFTGHVNFFGDGVYEWRSDPSEASLRIEHMKPLDFFKRYNRATGSFSCLSYCCVPAKVLKQLGDRPFQESGTEDSYCFSLLSLLGRSFVLAHGDLVAYRITNKSLSHNHVKSFGTWVRVFEVLEERFKQTGDTSVLGAFQAAFAAKRRSYAKFLLGNERVEEARGQIRQSLRNCSNPVSLAKSLGMLTLSYMPQMLQPKWPSGHRELGETEKA